jgi:hypothetical protein
MSGFDVVTALFVSFMIRSGFRERKYSRKELFGYRLRSGHVSCMKVDFRKIGY